LRQQREAEQRLADAANQEAEAARVMAAQVSAEAEQKAIAAQALAAQASLAVELGVVHAERARVEQEKAAKAEELLQAEREFVESERKSLALIDQKLTQQRITTASEVRASQAIAGRLEAEKAVAASAASAPSRPRLKPKPCTSASWPRAAQAPPTRPQRRKRCWKRQARRHAAQSGRHHRRHDGANKTAGTGNPPPRGCAESAGLGAGESRRGRALAADSGSVVATLDDARARKEAPASYPAEARGRSGAPRYRAVLPIAASCTNGRRP
jgi:hypothetical protein